MKLQILFLAATVIVFGSCSQKVVNPNSDFSLSVNQSVTIKNSGTITLINLTDNRCPPDVQCVRAGEAIAELKFESESENQSTIKLCTGADCRKSELTETGNIGENQQLVLLNVSRSKIPVVKFRIENR